MAVLLALSLKFRPTRPVQFDAGNIAILALAKRNNVAPQLSGKCIAQAVDS
jgi:hypothetical protein